MDELGVEILFKLDLPPVQDDDYGKEIKLRRYMERAGAGIPPEQGLRW